MSQFANDTSCHYKLYINPENTQLREKYKEYISKRLTNNNTDSGFDLFVPNEINYEPGNYLIFDHHIKCKMVIIDSTGNEHPTGYLIHPRSSVAQKYNLMMSNNTGVIDQDYRGNIKASMFCNWTHNDFKVYFDPDKDIRRAPNYKIKQNTRIIQICAHNYKPFKIEIVTDLDDTSTSSNGFDST